MTFEYICFLITNECNLKCDYCYRQDSEISYMPSEMFIQYLSKLKTLGCRILNITGGEPLLHPKWSFYLKYAHDMGFKVVLSTNSLLLNLENEALNNIDVLVVPLDGPNEKIDSIFRGKAHFETARAVINKYKNGNYPFMLKINTVMTKENYSYLENMIPLIIGDRISWRIFYCKRKGHLNHISEQEFINRDMFIKKIEDLNRINPYIIMTKECMDDVNENIVYTVLAPDGQIYLTQGENDSLLGNLGTLSPEEILAEVRKRELYVGTHISSLGI